MVKSIKKWVDFFLTDLAHFERACSGKLTYFSASYCALEPITFATEGMAKSKSGALGAKDCPRNLSDAAATAHVTKRLMSTTKTLYSKISFSGPKPTVMSRSWMSE